VPEQAVDAAEAITPDKLSARVLPASSPADLAADNSEISQMLLSLKSRSSPDVFQEVLKTLKQCITLDRETQDHVRIACVAWWHR
jgi:hypothetical protein